VGLDRRGGGGGVAGEEGRLRERWAVQRCRCVYQLCLLPDHATIAHDNKKGLRMAIPSPTPCFAQGTGKLMVAQGRSPGKEPLRFPS
jgi:hypothetical protein